MPRHVKGILFADYVRMIRSQKSVDWKHHLEEEDLAFLTARVEPASWYPMQTFERMGNAILKEIAAGDVEAARMWGRVSVDQLRLATPSLVADDDPLETLMRFKVLRSTFFDFEAVEVTTAASDHAAIRIHYHMGPMAEEAASFQTMGFFERLLVVAGAEGIEARFKQRSWAGDSRTVLELHWEPPP
ncbi:MAG: hypothetical protein KIS78_19115 [Labilithrix sp.]|nr:hypothetical protein [Labilithrix sp.]MCW5834520.1 hypothetical protein [Labilithrix sp.]